MTEQDRAALERCIEIASRDRECAESFEEQRKGKPDGRGGWFISPASWEEIAQHACYRCQMKSLNLRPWESTPAHARVTNATSAGPDDSAIKLRDQLIAAGLSIYEPDPLAALQRVQ